VGLNFGRSVIEDVRRGPASRLVRVAGVCDLDADKAKAAASELKVPAFSSLDELLAEPDIPAVGLFTGPVGRARLIRRIIRAGKHVMTTKPFELDPEAALSVLEEARRLGRVVHLNSPGPLLTPDMAQIRRWRETHALGLPVAARADVWVSYREKANGSWYDDPRRCPVAPVLRLGIYLINDLALIFGEAKQVRVLQSRLFTQRPTSDNAQVGILYRNGALANVFASFGVKDGEPYRYSLVVNFENGTIYRHRTNAGGRLSLVTANEAGGRCVERVPLDGTTGGYQWEAFCRAVRGERLAGEIAPEQIVAGVRVIRMMAEAAG
jgi:predicted dehydrogenase